MKRLALIALLLGSATAQAQPDPFAQTRLQWNKPQAPFHLFGSIYYVGMAGVSAFLIVTPKGDILTDGGLPESAPFIEQHIRQLGFKLTDVKVLLNSHAHFDHAGGLAQLKRDTAAQFHASAGDAPILESGRIGFGPSKVMPFPPVHVDHVVKDGDTVALGGVTLTAHLTPGHTPGCTTWTTTVDGKRVMFFCSISVAGNPLVGNAAYPQIVHDYRASFARLKMLKADIFLAPHGDQFQMAAKLARMTPGAPNPFVDPGEKDRFLATMEADFDAELKKQAHH